MGVVRFGMQLVVMDRTEVDPHRVMVEREQVPAGMRLLDLERHRMDLHLVVAVVDRVVVVVQGMVHPDVSSSDIYGCSIPD